MAEYRPVNRDDYDGHSEDHDDASLGSAILLLVALAVLLVTFIVVLSVINPWMSDFLSTDTSAPPTINPD